MKQIFSVLICFLIMACNEQKKTVGNEAEMTLQTDVPPQWLTFEGVDDNAKHIVMISGDEEYRSEEALPQLAKILSKHHGFKCTVLFAQNDSVPGMVNANYVNNIPGLEVLNHADMMIMFTRFRALPDQQMKFIDDYLKSGKPVMGLRTATHAFNFSKDSNSNYKHYSYNYKGDKEAWHGGFGKLVLGETWVSHHGHHKHQSTKGILAKGTKETKIVNGISDGDVWGASDVYTVNLPLGGDAQPIIMGQVMNRKGAYDENDIFYGMRPTDDQIAVTNSKGESLGNEVMPVAWTRTYQLPEGKKGKAFTSTVGAANDLLVEGTRKLLVNSVYWALNMEVPENAEVSLVGDYNPTKFEFRKDSYWTAKKVSVDSFK